LIDLASLGKNTQLKLHKYLAIELQVQVDTLKIRCTSKPQYLS